MVQPRPDGRYVRNTIERRPGSIRIAAEQYPSLSVSSYNRVASRPAPFHIKRSSVSYRFIYYYFGWLHLTIVDKVRSDAHVHTEHGFILLTDFAFLSAQCGLLFYLERHDLF